MSADSGANWPGRPANQCLNCGHAVTPTFERVFGDNNDDVYACPQCTDRTKLQGGATGGRR
jgi:DNA-directed RNA polymerase subunit RPC12/RpoP